MFSSGRYARYISGRRLKFVNNSHIKLGNKSSKKLLCLTKPIRYCMKRR